MARLYPKFLDPATQSAGERDLYEALARQLSDDWAVFHSVQRIQDKWGQPYEGEIDFVVAHPRHGILVVEVKGGLISFDEASQHFLSQDKRGAVHNIGNPFRQVAGNKGWLIRFLQERPDWPRTRIVIGFSVVFPDSVLPDNWSWQGIDRSVVIDHSDLPGLEERLVDILNSWRGTDQSPGRDGVRLLEKYLGQATSIRNPLLAEHIRADQQQILDLTEEQYDVLMNLETNKRVIIRGCAGSGKTMLAVQKAHQLVMEGGLKVLYVCFNEALAAYIGETLDYAKEFNVFSYYRLARHWGNVAGVTVPDYETSEVGREFFENTLPDLLLEIIGRIGPQYDAIVVDELQDFNQKWWDSLIWCLHDPVDGIFYAFGDENQRIFPLSRTQPAVTSAEGFVEYGLSTNCRNTKTIARTLDHFYSGRRLPKHKGPVGLPVDIRIYKDFAAMREQLRQILYQLVGVEHVLSDDIAVLTVRRSPRTDENLPGPPSELTDLHVGNFHLTRRPPQNPTQILARSIYSFKGLERPVIILTEIDDQIPAAQLTTLLYTAMSRAKSHLFLLVSEQMDDALRSKLAQFN